MFYHGTPLIRCSEPDCIKCHCKECEVVRVTGDKIIHDSSDGPVMAWLFTERTISLFIRVVVK